MLSIRSFVPIRSTLHAGHTVIEGRVATERILRGDDDRLLVVVG
jgi:3-deoxy-7-phosphoheptulonate synthase